MPSHRLLAVCQGQRVSGPMAWEAGRRTGTCPASQPNRVGGSIAMVMPPAAPPSGPQSDPDPDHFPPPESSPQPDQQPPDPNPDPPEPDSSQ
jgi:hypothetical protein